MSSPVSKRKFQKLMDEIEELKQKNEAHEEKLKYIERKNRDLSSINADLTTQIQRLKKKNRELVAENEAYVDEIQGLKKENLELISVKSNLPAKIEKYVSKIKDLEQRLCIKFDNSKVYDRITLSPVSVDKLQHCTEWWCPKHSKFATIVKDFEPNNEEDKLIVRRAKGRFKYWNEKDDGNTCCTNDRQNKNSNTFSPPSNWPK